MGLPSPSPTPARPQLLIFESGWPDVAFQSAKDYLILVQGLAGFRCVSGVEGKGDVCRLSSSTEKEREKYARVWSAHPQGATLGCTPSDHTLSAFGWA